MENKNHLGVVAADLLVILVLLKFSIQYMLHFGGWANILGFSLIVGGIIAVAIRLEIFKTLLASLAVFVFFGDLFLSNDANARVILGTMIITAFVLYFALILFRSK